MLTDAAVEAARPRAAACCPTCNQAISPQIKRGSLAITDSPVVVFWNGRVVTMEPAQARVLKVLARSGVAATEVILDAALGDGATGKAVAVYMTRLRKALPGLKITSIHGWGYRMEERAIA